VHMCTSIVLVHSVLHEAFGMVLLDAMLHGLPVIVIASGAAAAGAHHQVLTKADVNQGPDTQLLANHEPHTRASLCWQHQAARP
jgi:hypothetical protein